MHIISIVLWYNSNNLRDIRSDNEWMLTFVTFSLPFINDVSESKQMCLRWTEVHKQQLTKEILNYNYSPFLLLTSDGHTLLNSPQKFLQWAGNIRHQDIRSDTEYFSRVNLQKFHFFFLKEVYRYLPKTACNLPRR